MITKTLQLIKDQTGLNLPLCPYFTGVQSHRGRKYFNVVLSAPTCFSAEYDKLKRFSSDFGLILVEPNGLNRVAVFLNQK